MLRIAILTYSTRPRGGVVHSLYLGEALAKRGHQVRIFALDKEEGGGFFRPTSVPFTIIPYGKLPEDSFDAKIEKYIDCYQEYFAASSDEFDIYHAQDCISANSLLKVREAGRKFPIVRTVHHVDEFISPVLIKCQQDSLLKPDHHLVVSKYWQEQLGAEYGIQAKLIYNGLDIQRFSPATAENQAKKHFGLENKVVFLTIGGIEPRKNTIKLLTAFIQARASLAHMGKQAVLVIGGGQTLFDYTPYREEFFSLLEKSGLRLGEDVVNLGVLAEEAVPLLYRSADTFVFPSAKEGWGLVVLEALASGVPTIVSDIPVFHEYLRHGQEALFISPDHPEEFAAAMVETIVNQEIRAKLISRGLAKAAQFSWDNAAAQHESFYLELLRQGQKVANLKLGRRHAN